MRGSRPTPGPPSTMSGSTGQGLVYGTHMARGPQLAFTPEAPETGPKNKKTKLIVIVGIALPVLACIIGIAAWAVTTEVLRITPQTNDNSYNSFGHQGKARIESRSDTDVDVFVLHGITPPTSVAPTKISKTNLKISSTTLSSTSGATVSTMQAMTSPKASDILSKLLSSGTPSPKLPKNFIVFAPIADTENAENHRKGRRFDSKIIVHEKDDLVAAESVATKDTSQEIGKMLFNRKRQLPVESSRASRQNMRQSSYKKVNQKGKVNRNARVLSTDTFSENTQNTQNSPNLMKQPQRGEQYVTFPSNSKSPQLGISNRNGGITQSRTGGNFQRNSYPNLNQNNKPASQDFNKRKIRPEQHPHRNKQSFSSAQSSSLKQNYQLPAFQQPAPSQFQSLGPPKFQNQDQVPVPQKNKLPQQDIPSSNQYLKDNQRHFQGQQSFGSHFNQQKNLKGSSQSNYPNVVQNQPSVPEILNMNSGGPQYFAPPPQTFHTKINYDQSPKSPPSSLSTYEKVAQGSVDPVADGTHHHHHHHHHHEPVPSNSDPIGDVNYSDVPRAGDTDRLGTIGIGMGPSRGITLQIGGGGGGLSGLLPLGALGMAKNIVSALLPRPQLGLNSKVFLGVEVGRGGGLQLGLG